MTQATGVVLARTGGGYRVHTEAGEITATLRGKLKHRDTDRVVPGDVVALDGTTIAEIRPWRSVLARRAAQGSSGAGPRRAQPVAANVDQVVVVASARDPEPNPHDGSLPGDCRGQRSAVGNRRQQDRARSV